MTGYMGLNPQMQKQRPLAREHSRKQNLKNRKSFIIETGYSR